MSATAYWSGEAASIVDYDKTAYVAPYDNADDAMAAVDKVYAERGQSPQPDAQFRILVHLSTRDLFQEIRDRVWSQYHVLATEAMQGEALVTDTIWVKIAFPALLSGTADPV